MAEQFRSLDISDIPALAHLAEEVRTTGRTQVLRHEEADVAIEIRMTPKAPNPPKRVRKTGILTEDDSLFNIIGIAAGPDDGVTDVSASKHE